MARTFGKALSLGLSTLLLGASLAFAGGTGMPGTVTAVDNTGMATVKTSDGKELKVKAGEGWKAGAKVDCEMKDGKSECRPAK